MAVEITVDWDERVLGALLSGPEGPVATYLLGRAAIVQQGAKRRAPVSPDGSNGRPSGYLRSNIVLRQGRDSEGLYVDVVSSATTPTGYPYGLGVEVGTVAHTITSHGPYPLRSKDGRVFGRVVHHPGTDPQPYMRPALLDLLR